MGGDGPLVVAHVLAMQPAALDDEDGGHLHFQHGIDAANGRGVDLARLQRGRHRLADAIQFGQLAALLVQLFLELLGAQDCLNARQ